jgi:hypothetical protein
LAQYRAWRDCPTGLQTRDRWGHIRATNDGIAAVNNAHHRPAMCPSQRALSLPAAGRRDPPRISDRKRSHQHLGRLVSHSIGMDANDWWRDPTSAWWAKVDRAKHHINALAADIHSFLGSTAYEVVAEPGEQLNETIYRLRMQRPIPSTSAPSSGMASTTSAVRWTVLPMRWHGDMSGATSRRGRSWPASFPSAMIRTTSLVARQP